MKEKNPLELYKKYHLDRDNELIGLFTALNRKFKIKSALYPGSFVHFTPVLVFPRLVCVDSEKPAEKFFSQIEVYEYIQKNKQYKNDANLVFHLSDYYKDFGEAKNSFDLLISQYAGFISQACRKYLKKSGILISNDSHGDASMAFIDPEYEFIAVYNRLSDDEYEISEENLDSYFLHKSKIKLTKNSLEQLQKGLKYTKSPTGYLFKKK